MSRQERTSPASIGPDGRSGAQPATIAPDVSTDARVADLNETNRRLGDALQQARDDIAALNYAISHELRAPLRAIRGFTEIVLRQYSQQIPEAARRLLENVGAAGANLEELIAELLNYSRLGRRGAAAAAVPLEPLFDRLEQELSSRFGMDRLSTRGALPVVRGDVSLLAHVFEKLLENAATYTRPGVPPQIHIEWERKGEFAEIAVSDNGIGIDPVHHAKIFELFQRLHGQDQFPGTGVGLAIVKKAVALMNGRVWLKSEPGAGTTFFVQLPLVENSDISSAS